MDERLRYNDFSGFLAARFPYKVQKISLNAGFTCPNRDGSKGYGGCTYCNNQTFNPAYCRTEKSVSQQLEEGKSFFARKYPEMKFGRLCIRLKCDTLALRHFMCRKSGALPE